MKSQLGPKRISLKVFKNPTSKAKLFHITITNSDYEKAYFSRAVVVRHPLERILSAYRYSLADSTILTGLNEKAFAHWLPYRKDQYPPGKH